AARTVSPPIVGIRCPWTVTLVGPTHARGTRMKPASSTAYARVLFGGSRSSRATTLFAFAIITMSIGLGCITEPSTDLRARSRSHGLPPPVDSDAPAQTTAEITLAPVAPFREADYRPRSHPKHVELSPDGATLYVALEGNLLDPLSEVLAIDAQTGEVK